MKNTKSENASTKMASGGIAPNEVANTEIVLRFLFWQLLSQAPYEDFVRGLSNEQA